MSSLQRIRTSAASWLRFVADPASSRPLAVLRIGIAALLLIQSAYLFPHIGLLFDPDGIVQTPIANEMTPAMLPRLGWVVAVVEPWGVGASAVLRCLAVLHVAAALALLVGYRTRTAAIVAWGSHLLFMINGQCTNYGAIELLNIALFYCCVFPVGDCLSIDSHRNRKKPSPENGSFARLGLRVLQAQMCVIYASAGFEKALGEQWWNGEALWQALSRSDMATADFSLLAWVPWLAMAGTIGTLLVECGYPFFAWWSRTRNWIVGATIAMHVGIALALNLWLFAAVMILLNVCAWFVPSELAGSVEADSGSSDHEIEPLAVEYRGISAVPQSA